ncbi:lipoprotein, partial [human gut metagenome]
NAILTITNKTTGEEVARINLADYLAQGRGAFEARHYSAQEFLDREYDYKLDFFLQGNQWKYVQLSISILDWSKRIQRVDF